MLEAGSISTKDEVQAWRCKHKGNLQEWETIFFSTKFSVRPAFVTTIQTMANEKNNVPPKPSNPFLTVATRGLNAKKVQVGLERMELGKTVTKLAKAETIGYVAMTPGTGDVAIPGKKDVGFASVVSKDMVIGWGRRSHKPRARQVKFGKNMGPKPIVVASVVSRDGGDGGWLRVHRVRTGSADVVIDEDRGCDRERSHTTERVAMIVWTKPC